MRSISATLIALAMTLAAPAQDAAALPDTPPAAPVLPEVPKGGWLLIESDQLPEKAPAFYATRVETTLQASEEGIQHTSQVAFNLLQGRPEKWVLDLTGDGEVISVIRPDSTAVDSWAVRRLPGDTGARQLEIAVRPGEEQPPTSFVINARSEVQVTPADLSPILLGPGEAAGFTGVVTLNTGDGWRTDITLADGLLATNESAEQQRRFLQNGSAKLSLRLRAATGEPPAELADVAVDGAVDPETGVATFMLTANAVIRQDDTILPVLTGNAAITTLPEDHTVSLNLLPTPRAEEQQGAAPAPGGAALAFAKKGTYPLSLTFEAPFQPSGPWRGFSFSVPSGTLVPLTVRGLGKDVIFDTTASVFPVQADNAWKAWLPVDGRCDLRWQNTRGEDTDELFVNSTALVDIAVTAGLARQTSQLNLRVLQGKLNAVEIGVDGPGEILAVSGTNVAGWTVRPDGDRRVLDIRLSRPLTGQGQFTIQSQTALAAAPERTAALRLTPMGERVRHAGHLRVRAAGAVRVEVGEARGLMQLAPNQWPAEDKAEGRQVFVYRFPVADHTFTLSADRIVPEIGVNQVLVYEMGETDRIIHASLELDIREAPLREWELLIPDDHALAAVQGADVADSVLGGEAGNGQRRLKILFNQPVQGRRLVNLRLERNDPAKTGAWTLPPITFPKVRNVRGFLGVASTPGFRLSPGKVDGLAETPLSYFPQQREGLQHAFRIRQADWSAQIKTEAMGRNIQADLFHLVTLREGMATSSVVVDFFTVGAPASAWRFTIPENAGNLVIDGQGVRNWRREDGTVIVDLEKASLGASTLLITFEQPLDPRGGSIQPGAVQPVGVQGERGYIQVVSPGQVRHEITAKSDNLLQLEASELPSELGLLSRLTAAPSLAVFQYNERPFELAMELDWFTPAETAEQMVDFAELESTIAWDGQVVTQARWFVKTRGRGTLRLQLPGEALLWEVRAAGELVNARQDGQATLVPLPGNIDPVKPIEVSVRYGQPGDGGRRASLAAPTLDVPTVMGEWKLTADRGRALIPAGGTAIPPAGKQADTGFQALEMRRIWIPALALLVLTGAGMVFRRVGSSILAMACLLLAGTAAVGGAAAALTGLGKLPTELTYVAPVVPSGEAVTILVENVKGWSAAIPWLALVAAAALALVAVRPDLLAKVAPVPTNIVRATACVIATALLLAQRGGAFYFFIAAGLALLALLVTVLINRPAKIAAAAAAAVALLAFPADLLAGTLASADQEWRIKEGRLTATATLTADAETGERFTLLRPPATLTGFDGEGWRVMKSGHGGHGGYVAVATRDGRLTGTLRFEMPVPEGADHVAVPTGPAAINKLAVTLDEEGWEITSPQAVRTRTIDHVTSMLLPPGAPTTLVIRPATRDLGAEETRFFAESSNLFLPAPGVVNTIHRIGIRPSQGRVESLDLIVPEGFMIGDVQHDALADWRFDPAGRKLTVRFAPPRERPFAFTVAGQMAAGGLPYDATVAPLQVQGAAGSVGLTALAFGPDAQPDGITPEDMTPVDAGDFDASLLPAGQDDKPPLLQHVFRHEATGSVKLSVLPVEPDIKAVSSQVLSFGEERLVLAVDLQAEITRAGVFSLSFPLPKGWELEAASGNNLTHWTEGREGDDRLITLHLAGRTMGQVTFALSLSGPSPGASKSWKTPRLILREASRQTGLLTVVPERGIRIRPVERTNVSLATVDAAGPPRPGALAFRLLQADWSLALAIESLDAWVTCRALQEIAIRDGQVRTRIGLRLKVENAAVKSVQLRLPGVTGDDARSVRAAGDAVADVVRLEEDGDIWEIRFQRGVIGEVPLDIQYQQGMAQGFSALTIPVVAVPDARQSTVFVALRSSGRLELDASTLPRGWQRTDWQGVPATLQNPTDRSAPAHCFRTSDPEEPLELAIRRQSVAEVLKLRISKAAFTTVLSPDGDAVTTADLQVRVTEMTSLRMRAPEDAVLLELSVQGESASLAREGGNLLFHVVPGADPTQPVPVRFTYATRGDRPLRARLAAPAFDVPMEDVEWQIILPKGHRLVDHDGSLTLEEGGGLSFLSFDVHDYLQEISGRAAKKQNLGSASLSEGNKALAEGKMDLAQAAFNRAANNLLLDDASNEDARVQLRNLQTQQAVMGLNTRRQKLYLDNSFNNSGQPVPNDQFEQAARENPLLQGKQVFDPRQLDGQLQGNTIEETSTLKRLADRLVAQQAGGIVAPRTLEVALPENQATAVFGRSVQVDRNAPLELELAMAPPTRPSPAAAFALLLAIGLLALFAGTTRKEEEPVMEKQEKKPVAKKKTAKKKP